MYYKIQNIMKKVRTIANFNIFDKIDSEEKAYWLGFIYADGNIASINTKNIRHNFELNLSSKDLKHLEKFNNFISSNKDIRIEKAGNLYQYERCRITFANKHFWNVLNNYGCIPKKSLTLEFPNENIFENKELIKHFIRGYIDGDGCISYCDKDHKHMTLRILGTEKFLNTLQNYLPLEKKNKLNKTKNIYNLSFQKSRGNYILDYIYKDATIYLKRKFDRYTEYCRLYQE